MPGLSVIVPCYNEEATLGRFIPQLMAEAEHFSEFEVIVVDDASRDGSPVLIESLQTRFKLRSIRNETNLGLGGAVRRGYDDARMEWITYLPADGQVPAEEVRKFLPYMADYDIIIGRRISTPDYTRYRKVASRVYTTWVSLAFGLRVRDFNWVQAWRRSLWNQHPSSSNSVFICGEFLVRSRAAQPRMVEIEIGYRPRTEGRAKNGNPRAALRAASDITRLLLAEARAGRFHFLHPFAPDRPGRARQQTGQRKAA
jgi:glycosyltransferase involved in cell wall biosynthesis